MGWNILCCCKFSLAENEKNGLKLIFWRFSRNYRIGPESWKCFRTVLGKLQKLTQNFQKLQNSPCANCCCPDLFLLLFWLFCPPIWTQIEAQSLTQLPFDINCRIRLRKLKFWGLGAPQNPSPSIPFILFSSLLIPFLQSSTFLPPFMPQ